MIKRTKLKNQSLSMLSCLLLVSAACTDSEDTGSAAPAAASDKDAATDTDKDAGKPAPEPDEDKDKDAAADADAAPAKPDAAPEKDAGAAAEVEPLYVTSTVVFNPEGQNSYVSVLANVDTQNIDLKNARELSGWAGVAVHDGALYMTDGESPTLRRFKVKTRTDWEEDGAINFSDHGAEYADSLFVGDDKAYVFPGKNGLVWTPSELAISGDFEIPKVADREGGLEFGGLGTGRTAVRRGNRLYVTTNWANWDDYIVSEDSLIFVIDTEQDKVIDMLPAPCPYLDVATLADDGSVYFSNWIYSIGQTVLQDKAKACAIRLKAGEDKIDEDWKLTFADVTGGHEAAAMHYLGDNKAVISVFHEERLDRDDPEINASSVGNSELYELWTLDLESHEAKPIEGIGSNTGGVAVSRVDGRAFVMIPTGDWESTSVYEVSPSGKAEKRWTTNGWSTQLLKLR
jgi:hypothetical protein